MHRVLVVGLPRGGTTWVGRVLGNTRNAAYVHEPDGVHEPFAFRARLLDGVDHHAIVAAGADLPEYERLWSGAFAGGAPGRGARARVAGWAYRGVPAAARQAARETGAVPLRLRLAVRAAEPLRPVAGLDAVVVKSVNAALATEWVWDRFRPAVVVVRRDIRNVCASWLSIGFGPPGPRVYERIRDEARRRWQLDLPAGDDGTTRIAVLCTVLTLGLREGLRAHPEWTSVSHEDACVEPVSVLRAAAAAAGLVWTDDATAFVEQSNRPGTGYATERVATELPEQWSRRLDDEQIDRVEAVLARVPAELWNVSPSAR